jgi:hypothetical protein
MKKQEEVYDFMAPMTGKDVRDFALYLLVGATIFLIGGYSPDIFGHIESAINWKW